MSKHWSSGLLCGLLLIVAFSGRGQSDCSLRVDLVLQDAESGQPVPFAHVHASDTAMLSNAQGEARLLRRCPGRSEVFVSHIAYTNASYSFQLSSDTTLLIPMSSDDQILRTSVIRSEPSAYSSQQGIGRRTLEMRGDKNLSESLASLPAVNVLRTGNISKPVVLGAIGSRVPILIDDFTLQGQQWGNDHAPEVDPAGLKRVQVLHGAERLLLTGEGFGSAVRLEEAPMLGSEETEFHANQVLETNGLALNSQARVAVHRERQSFFASGSYRNQGDLRAPDYYLTNTAARSTQFKAAAAFRFGEDWQLTFGTSAYGTQRGLLRGSHIGNLTDLNQALERDEPFFTEDAFDRSISNPRQEVVHQTAHTRLRWERGDWSFMARYARQSDQRREYDVRRGDRDSIPALSLDLTSDDFLFLGKRALSNGALEWSLNHQYIRNTNNPETGILPLIPDFRQRRTGAAVMRTWEHNDYRIRATIRGEQRWLLAWPVSDDIPRTYLRREQQQLNLGAVIDGKWVHRLGFLDGALGFARRAPESHELYSVGLHQGAGGIEEGDSLLGVEQGVHAVLTSVIHVNRKLVLRGMLHARAVADYIYLAPTGETRLTIRGAFPVFSYLQDDVLISGLDARLEYKPVERFELALGYGYTRGSVSGSDLPLIYMPPQFVNATVERTIYPEKNSSENWLQVGLDYRWIFTQSRNPDEIDFAPAPDGAGLLSGFIRGEWELPTGRLSAGIHIENALNTSYRNYLNRLRYFSDEQGINAVLSVGWTLQ